jgi:ribosomal protein L40E
MTKKTLGYVRLEWTCPNCGSKNPGPQKTCTNCGYAQPEDIRFTQAAQEELLQDQTEIAQAKAGPDIHCYYCGTRNPAGAKTCSQCGADLSQGAARRSGQVLGVHRSGPAGPVVCPACAAANDPGAATCISCGASLAQAQPPPKPAPPPAKPAPAKWGLWPKVGLVALAVAVCAVCAVLFTFYNRTDAVTGQVESVSWQRAVQIEALVPVTHEEWRSEIPGNAQVGRCTQKLHHTQDEPASDAEEICGAPYTVDKGSGFGEVVQDCQYQVYAPWCEYTLNEWREVDTITLAGDDLNPRWPPLQLAYNQREGERDETYKCLFKTEDGLKIYAAADFEQYRRCQIGSRWVLEVNTFNTIRSIAPAE